MIFHWGVSFAFVINLITYPQEAFNNAVYIPLYSRLSPRITTVNDQEQNCNFSEKMINMSESTGSSTKLATDEKCLEK